jgi:hypothetical protein
VQHEHEPGETVKFLGEVQSAYQKELELPDAVELRPLHRIDPRLCE